MKVWIGLLAASLADQVTFESSELPDISFATSSRAGLPFAGALVELAEAHFGFQSALSAPAEGANHEERFRALEASMARIAESVDKLVSGADRVGPVMPPPGRAGAKTKAVAKKPRVPPTEGSVPGTPKPPGRAKEVASLDPAVTRAALGAGVSPGELAEISRLMRGGRGNLDDFPGADEAGLDDGVGSVAAPSGVGDDVPDLGEETPAVERAVLALTGIMKQLVDKKKQVDRPSTLDAYLDHAEGPSGSDVFGLGSSSGSRSKAAAYRLLRESLEKSPELIYQEVERLMDEDLLSRRAVGALTSAQSSARAWIEFRSRVGYYPTTIRTLWCLGGILDCLRDDRVGEARARTCLVIAALDQQCIDAGAWTYAQEVLLEAPPPLGSFQNRRVLHDPLESHHTKLLSSRWSDVLLHRVKEMETFLEAKRKLGRGRGNEPSAPSKPSDEVAPRCAEVARADATALQVTATVLDSLLGLPYHRVTRGPVASLFAGTPPRAHVDLVARCWDRLGLRLNQWNAFEPVTRDDLGRSAGKVEKIEEQIRVLQLDSVGGTSVLPSLALAQDVVASRIAFTGVPEFDPCPYLDDKLRDLYLRPVSRACASWCCGVFSVPKSSDRDRLIIDARPSNAVQVSDSRWLSTMPTSACLLSLELDETEVCTFSGADIREFYHNFRVSEQRSSLYTFVGDFAASDVACLRCFSPELLGSSRVCASLRTMAMGDVNSVSFGQASHVGLLLAFDVIDPSCLLTLRGGFPRGDLALGVVIDDLICIERSLRHLGPAKASPVMEKDQFCAAFWGSEVDGFSGWVRPSWARLVPLVSLTLACVKLPALSISLLEILAGSWISVVSYRRRLLSLLNHIYLIQRGRRRDEVVRSTTGLRAELFALCALAPFIVCDMRAASSGYLVCTDASDLVGAGAGAYVGNAWGKELQRHALCKGLWNRLLRPSECILRCAGALEQDLELPGESYRTHAMWSSLCRFLQFRVIGSFKRRGASHINVKEAESYLAVEEHLGAGVWESARTLALLDSQVVLGALIKGRSSSPALNVLLQGSVPAYIFFNLHPSYSFVASEDNPSDDPSRLKPIRSPSVPVPSWFEVGTAGDFSQLDSFLSAYNLLPGQLQGLPELLASFAARCGDPLPTSAARREYSEGQRDDPLQGESVLQSRILVENSPEPLQVASENRALDFACSFALLLLDLGELRSFVWAAIATFVFEGSSSTAFVGHLRVGEAANPGPPKRAPRQGSLFDVELVGATTLRVREQIWTVFVSWLREGLSEGAVLGIFRCPPLLSLMLRDYGDVLYRTGFPLGAYRQLLAHAQKLVPLVKPHMCVAWNMVTRWQELQPVCHRTPLPEAILRAMVGLAYANGWKVWAATTLAMFYFICRPGEVLRGLRKDLLTPGDTLEPQHKWLYLRIRAPKTRRRGAKIQHAKLDDAVALEVALSVWEKLPRGRALYPGSPSAFRRCWDVLLRSLAIPATASLTPASARAGGAICAFQRGTPVADLMWRMRLRSQVTFEHYLQEMTGYSVIPALPHETRRRIEVANCFFRAVEEKAIYYRAARLAASSGVEAAARQPFRTQIGVGQVIRGWDEGVPTMSLGEKAILRMTSDYGYGARGAGRVIPPNADLTFEVQNARPFPDMDNGSLPLGPAELLSHPPFSDFVCELITTVVFYPVELVKSRMQAAALTYASSSYGYKGLADGILCILRDEGVQGLFTGLRPVILRACASDFVAVYAGEKLLQRFRVEGGFALQDLLWRTLGCCVSVLTTLPLEGIATRVLAEQNHGVFSTIEAEPFVPHADGILNIIIETMVTW
ncbi:FK506-binding protein 1A [Symbiodinium microadriaticum]|uniref:peptidylprolyl isomerase n=1 Tax=Symbiodinium microadriaticum TaxID=2951 RepID=A0A1Q9EIC0_SYMMI|nr:FK506-binding protein 1A [Symbiodinium microadriaticum]